MDHQPTPETPPPGTGPHTIQLDSWISCSPFEKLLGMKILEAKDGRATLSMPFLYKLAQGAGLMHGGALVSLADTAMVMAIKTILPENAHFATIYLDSHYLKAVRSGTIIAKAGITSREGRIIKGKVEILNATEEPVMTFSATFKLGRDVALEDVGFSPA